MCDVYNIGEDSISHLFFTCRSVYNIWNLCNNWFWMNSVQHCMSRDQFLGFQLCRINRIGFSVDNTVWMIIV